MSSQLAFQPPVALIFPGQGAQAPGMLDGVRNAPRFAERLAIVCEYTSTAGLESLLRAKPETLTQNQFSTLLTVLVSTLSLDRFRQLQQGEPQYFAGHSVGQWTAMYAAGMLDFESLIRILHRRAQLMDECARRVPGGMCAVIGLTEAALQRVLAALRSEGQRVFISNRNCYAHYTIAGTVAAVDLAVEHIASLKPRKLARLPVSGAWHCPILEEAERPFADLLRAIEFRPRSAPIVDNVTGDWLPSDHGALCETLARHLSHPVQWQAGVGKLIGAGCNTFVEIGYGNMLTKLGFFIDRQRRFIPFYDVYGQR